MRSVLRLRAGIHYEVHKEREGDADVPMCDEFLPLRALRVLRSQMADPRSIRARLRNPHTPSVTHASAASW